MSYTYDVESYDYAWLRLKQEDVKDIQNPLLELGEWEQENFHLHVLKILRNPKYIHWTIKHILNIDLLSEQVVIMQELWTKSFPMYIASRGFGKSFLLAVYATLRCLLIPGSKIVIVGAAFRQSKVIFEYMDVIWRNAPILRSLCNDASGPRRDVDRCTLKVNDSWTIAVPLGDGNKIRGLRAHTIIADEFNSIPVEIYETVVTGFASVSKDPTGNVKNAAKRKAMKEDGVWSDQQEVRYQERHKNQSILSGTAGYGFEPYADYWRKYKLTINSKGDMSKVTRENGDDIGDDIPDYMKRLNWEEFSIIRIPYELIPEGFMDDQQVSRSRATMHSGIYLMEYGACKDPNTLITTDKGVKKIIDVEVGDLVLTHKGRFRKVTKKLFRRFRDNIVRYRTLGYNKSVGVTPNHPYWTDEDNFKQIGSSLTKTSLVNLNELSGRPSFCVEDVCTDILETLDGFKFYPKGSQSRVGLKEQRVIRNNICGYSSLQLSERFDISQSSVVRIQNNKNVPKNSIPTNIELNYDFGLIVGYYAAEGFIGVDGRQVEFALDGHKDTEYQKQLLEAIFNVFGFHGKSYIKDKNTISIAINSRLVSEVMKFVCPGLSEDKLINHDILFSNEKFLKGVVEGYWNGDGHIRDSGAFVHCINQSLLNQIRLCLSYFNISSSLMDGSQDNDFHLKITGDNFRNFIAEFYGEIISSSSRKQNIINDGCKTELPITESYLDKYDGFVYNLEVEEDNSYSGLNATVHNCFAKDSQGFFKRTLIESCVAHEANIGKDSWPLYCHQPFDVVTRGRSDRKYVFGIDPASEVDNFAIIILELHQSHQRLVYSWTTNKKDFQTRKKLGLTEIDDYYSFCVRKIRDLMQMFPCVRIGIDSQGGGYQIAEGLRDPDKMREELNEQPILEIIEEGKEKDTNRLPGLHILEFINFASADWTSQANHGLRKDMEDKFFLFPRFDQLTLGMISAQDEIRFKELKKQIGDSADLKLYDTLEDVVMDIEDLKMELSTIMVTRTASGREKFDTPEIKLGIGKKGRMRKDRYSALVIANMIARSMHREIPPNPTYNVVGRVAQSIDKGKDKGKMYYGQEWAAGYGSHAVTVVRRNVF